MGVCVCNGGAPQGSGPTSWQDGWVAGAQDWRGACRSASVEKSVGPRQVLRSCNGPRGKGPRNETHLLAINKGTTVLGHAGCRRDLPGSASARQRGEAMGHKVPATRHIKLQLTS